VAYIITNEFVKPLSLIFIFTIENRSIRCAMTTTDIMNVLSEDIRLTVTSKIASSNRYNILSGLTGIVFVLFYNFYLEKAQK